MGLIFRRRRRGALPRATCCRWCFGARKWQWKELFLSKESKWSKKESKDHQWRSPKKIWRREKDSNLYWFNMNQLETISYLKFSFLPRHDPSLSSPPSPHEWRCFSQSPFDGWTLNVAERRGDIWMFPKIGYPQIIHFYKVFHYYKPSIFVIPLFLETPTYVWNVGETKVNIPKPNFLMLAAPSSSNFSLMFQLEDLWWSPYSVDILQEPKNQTLFGWSKLR